MYYVYRHIRLDTNEPFYIGIGTKSTSFSSIKTEYKRAFSKRSRTKYWHNILINEYSSATEAAKQLKTTIQNISRAIRKKGTAKGYSWEYKRKTTC